MSRTALAGAGLTLLALLLTAAIVIVVPETREALIVRLGVPERIANPYHAGTAHGTGAGLAMRLPLAEQVVWIDRRVLAFGMERQAMLSSDRPLEVDAFARYRIVDPVRMYMTARNAARVGEALKPILASALRDALATPRSAALLSPESGLVMQDVRTALDHAARRYGAAIIDVRIRRADLPEGAPLAGAFERMRTARQQEARYIEAEGRRQAQIISGDADAEAARIYAASFGKDPDFYDFYRAMQSYRATFGTDDGLPRGSAQIILSPDSDYLRQFEGRQSHNAR